MSTTTTIHPVCQFCGHIATRKLAYGYYCSAGCRDLDLAPSWVERAEAAEAERDRLRDTLNNECCDSVFWRQRAEKIEIEVADWIRRAADAEVELAKVKQQNSRLRAALEAVEWEWGGGRQSWCPWCDAWREDGHAPDCARQRALGREP